jgi:hypothetical protein
MPRIQKKGNNIMKSIKLGLFGTVTVAAIWFGSEAWGQTNLNFNGISATVEGAIQISWNSTSNETYEIDEADALGTNSDGSTAWNQLYTGYPSQGTNTFWLDTGNYSVVPPVVHPKYSPARFYRIVDLGLDTTSDEPTVSITSITNDSIVSDELTITVVAATDQPILSGTKLFVDGQEMQMADSTSNYVNGSTNFEMDTYSINTCEWWNGSHILFATAKCASGLGDALNGATITTGNAVSPFVPVVFSNLVTEIAFSQPSFDPSSGQMQVISVTFAVNVNWTLNIEDASSNIVFTTTGSGPSMQYSWDGNGTGETNLPNGIYYYYITAQTNGQPLVVLEGGGGGGGGSGVPSPDFAAFAMSQNSDATQLWAQPLDGSGPPVPLIIYPPGFDTNAFNIFEAPASFGVEQYEPVMGTTSSRVLVSGGLADDASPAYSGGGSQGAPRAPQRPPTNPIKGFAGTFGIAFQEYFPEMLQIAAPPNNLEGKVQIQGSTQNAKLPFIEDVSTEDFITTMARGAWQPGFKKKDSQLLATDLRSSSAGGANVFNNGVSFGVLSLHAGYGTSQDATPPANFAQQIYFAVDGRPNNTTAWVRMSELNLGSPGTNGLKWMVLACCNSLRQQNWNSIRNAGWLPFNGNLHLLLGANSVLDAGNQVIFAKYMLGLDNNPQQPIYNAWGNSEAGCLHHPVQFAATGYDDCKGDVLTGTNSYTPQGSVFYDLFQAQ